MKNWNILIDFDGTLHDTESVFASKLDGLLGMDGKTLYHLYLFDIHRKIIHNQFPNRHNDIRFHWKLLLDYLNKPVENDLINLLDLRFREADKTVFKNPKFFKDVPEFLDRALDGGHTLCLSTGGGNSAAKAKIIAKFFGRDYFDKVFGEETLGYLKHDPKYYTEALKQLSWNSKTAVSIGDSIPTDVYPAKLVGIKTIWVDRKNDGEPIKSNRTPWYIANNLISAIEYIESL